MVRWLRRMLAAAPFVALALGLAAPRHAQGLPLFARKYDMACTSCHVAFPRLNDFGMKFRQNGYRIAGSEGESPWEDQKSFPLSLVGNVGYDMMSTNHHDPVSGDWSRFTKAGYVQNQVEFHSAGTLAKKITFHFDNNFGDTGNGAIVLISGMAFVQFDDLAKDGKLNLKTGIYDAEIPYLSSSRRTTWHDYMMAATLDGQGVELNGTQDAWSWALGLINSSRTLDAVLARKPDTKTVNNLQDPYLWVMRDIGQHEVTARVFLDSQDPRKDGSSSSQHVQADLSALYRTPHLWIIPDYTYEHFNDADASDSLVSPIPKEIHRGLLEAMALLGKDDRWVVTGRYELAHNPKTSLVPEADLSLGTLNVSYFVNPNCKVALDWSRTWDNQLGDRVDEVMALVHLGY